MSQAFYNGSYLSHRPTGLGVVARELMHALNPGQIRLLDPLATGRPGSISIPTTLGPGHGRGGHWRRLRWTQMLLPALMKRHGSDLLLSPLPEAPLFRDIRSVVLVHDLIPLRFPRVTPLLAYHMTYLPLVLQQAERVLCNSLSTARDVHQRLKVPHHKLQPISLGVNPNQFYPLDRQREPFFLVLGRHDPHKNLKRVLKAFAALSCPEFQLKFVGPHHTSYTPSLQRLAKELQIDGRCQWYPWVSDGERLELLNRCQALLIPSLWEGFGLPALEAMACGTPVIGGNQGALPEVLGEVGLLVDPLRTEAITSAMQRLISEPQLSAQLAGSGVHRAAQYSWSTTAQQVQRVITALA